MQLYLLSQDSDRGQGSIEIDGLHWGLTTHNLDASDVEEVQFTCVSYTWGEGRESSPFHPSHEVSDRTIPALTAVVRHRPSCTHIWIDAFCVPVDAAPERAHTLESMGYIYSRANEVIVVLSVSAHPVLQKMNASDRVDPVHLDILEREEWVSRAWTYQEAANSKVLYITCEESHGVIIPGNHFLNCLGYTLTRLDGSVPSASEKRQRYPRLDAFEDLIAEYMLAGYQERSALQVMSNMDRRTQRHAEDHFYAMIGAISTARASSTPALDPCEAFMTLCERKGDYSFIYSAAKRDSTPSKRWRPVPGDLPAILPWHCYGEGQPGHKESGTLYLDLMLPLGVSPIVDDGKEFVQAWLAASKFVSVGPGDSLQEAAHAALRVMGFKGSPDCVTTSHGFFFPSERISADKEFTVLVATAVRWSFGAPALARCRHGNEETFTPGAFFGRVDNEAAVSVRVS
ncbi:uncharacterized protein Z520_04547 [Fonsecaea multimorphosa CBS 102226]|uniref:Heterokaryon incompatibility domain-containing protein n=1 Tax=Fonsecaea multimorphosa CBS 102226 TaxID=1442371 RepID=A0A0D2HDF8_9EURO|nr:uncharacterized protein Z520_04547 [Fonsecaea multimorphosa CBS 102226]KIX99910.1 hypothetical protein Z520_04547 [Fonsecaea multimorphosa CBS 102226]OAL26385.1 hypothetical protein AYO22_04303 [Fonsecaea multimorphosa]